MNRGVLPEVEAHLESWLIRWRLRAALIWGARGLLAGAAAGLGLSLVAWLRPFRPVPVLAALALGLALAGGGLAMALAYFWPRPRLAAARHFDRLLGLAERTSTALELAAPGDTTPDWLRRDQWADAAAAARQARPRQTIRLAVDRRDVGLLLVVALALAASLYFPNPMQLVLARQQAVDRAIAEQVEALEAAREQIGADPALTEEQKEELTQPLDEAIEQLQSGDLTQEQAVQILTETQRDLNALSDNNAQDQAEALQQAGSTLAGSPQTETAGQALATGDFQQAAEDLADLDLDQLGEAERQALAELLEQAAAQLAASNPEVAEQLQAAADALATGDVAQAEAALAQAGQAMAATGQAAAQAQAAANAAAAAGAAQQAVAQAGGSEQGQGQGTGQGTGQGQGAGQGQGDGNGSSQTDGQGAGSGAGQGEGSGEGQGGEAGTDPIEQGNGPGDGGERPYEEIYTPYHLGGAGGQDVTVDGQGGEGGEIIGEGPTNPDEAGGVTVPYNEVYEGYADSAYQAIEGGAYPLDLAAAIRTYFTSLSP